MTPKKSKKSQKGRQNGSSDRRIRLERTLSTGSNRKVSRRRRQNFSKQSTKDPDLKVREGTPKLRVHRKKSRVSGGD